MEKQPFNIPMQWNVNISILKNPLLWFQMIMVLVISTMYLLLLSIGLNLYENQWERIPESFIMPFAVGGGLFIAFSLITFLMFWRGIPTKYVMRDGYIEQHTLSKISKIANRFGPFAIFSGTSAGATAAGSSLLAKSREIIAIEWKDVTDIKAFPARNEIQLHNDWRTIMQVVCPADQFEDIYAFIKEKTVNNTKPKLTALNETAPAIKLILSLTSVIAGILLFPRLPIHFVGIFTIATIVFAFLALWSSGLKQRVFGLILLSLPIIGVALAFIVGEVEMYHSGAIYALIIELLLLGFFMFIGFAVAFKKIR